MQILTAEQRKNLTRYVYRGADNSYLYKFLLSPLAKAIANNLPNWLAPNTITFIGLLFSVISCILTLCFNPTLGTSGPPWLHLASGLCLFAYQTLDNVDGQQARRTKTSSPLGMLFDHGCDAVNAGVSSLAMGSVFGTGWTMGLFLGLFAGFVPFYFQTWEEYYLGEMILPVVNGPSEGLLVACMASVVSFLYGAQWWHSSLLVQVPQSREFIDTLRHIFPLPPISSISSSSSSSFSPLYNPFEDESKSLSYMSSPLSDSAHGIHSPMLTSLIHEEITMFRAIVFIALIGVFLTFVSQFLRVMFTIVTGGEYVSHIATKVGFQNKRYRVSSRGIYVLLKPVLDLLPITVFFSSIFLWCLFSKSALIETPLISVAIMSVIFVELVTHVMLQHVCDSITFPFQRYLIIPLILLALNVTSFSLTLNGHAYASRTTSYNPVHLVSWDYYNYHGSLSLAPVDPYLSEVSILYPLFLSCLLYVPLKLYLVCIEAADELNIYVFRTDKKPEKTKAEDPWCSFCSFIKVD